MHRPLWKSIGYQTIKNSFWLIAKVFFRFSSRGKEHVPRDGGMLICSNHQSYFDPVLVGICFRQQLNFLARKTLFDTFLFGRIIRYLDAIPVDRDGMSLGGIKETLKRLKKGEGVVVFPEGTRSEDGRIGLLKPGFCVLARRGLRPDRSGRRGRSLRGLAAIQTTSPPHQSLHRLRSAYPAGRNRSNVGRTTDRRAATTYHPVLPAGSSVARTPASR